MIHSVPKPRSRRKKAPRPLKRGGRIARGKPMKTRPRSRSEKARVYGDAAFIAHVHASPCLWCGVTRPIEQAHILPNKSVGKKGTWHRTGPLCGAFTVGPEYTYPGCHARFDRRSSRREWFTEAEREVIRQKQAAFILDWMQRGAK